MEEPQGITYSLSQQEFVDCFLFPHALHNQTVQVDKQSTAKTTSDSTDKDKEAICQVSWRWNWNASWEKTEPASLKDTGVDLHDPLW